MRDAFLLFDDPTGRQRIVELPHDRASVTIGRRSSCDVPLPWDDLVSRLHAQLMRLGSEWVLCDEGLSHNGTFVNGEHVQGRRRLVAGDVITIGGTPIVLCAADGPSSATPTLEPRKAPAAELTPAQQRVLVALSRPLLDAPHGAPASNRAIAEELVLSVDTVKNTLSALFVLFGLTGLPQNAKRVALAAHALDLLSADRYA
jgi:pSer/pThr/pTyr-binding forkhead associated (FHA) protein